MKKVCSKREKNHRKSDGIRVEKIDSQVAKYLLHGGMQFYCDTFVKDEKLRDEILDQIRLRFGCKDPQILFYNKSFTRNEVGQSFYFFRISLPNPNKGYHNMRIQFREKIKINTKVR